MDRKFLACLSLVGNWPVTMLLLMSSAIEGAKQLPASLKILGPSSSKPAAFDESSLFMNEQTCSTVMKGI